MLIVHLLAAAVIGLTLVLAIRWIGTQSPVLRVIVVGGLVARAVLGLSLFWISYLRLPVLESLQFGNGFWTLMIDATGYYQVAADAVSQGLSSIDPGSASPFYTRTLTVWMSIVGVAPPAGMYLNLCLYVWICALLVRLCRPLGDWRADLPLVLAVLAVSFSPGLVINSTQPLKDHVFLGLLVLMCVAAYLVLPRMQRAAHLEGWSLGGALAALLAAIYGIAGMRAYYAVIIWFCLLLGLATAAMAAPGRVRLRRATGSAVLLAVVWAIYGVGAGPSYRPHSDERRRFAEMLHVDDAIEALTGLFTTATGVVDTARAGFVSSGGDTNIARRGTSGLVPGVESDGAPGVESDGAPGAVVSSGSSPRIALVIGAAVIVIPISVLKALSIVQFSGGRGMLLVADLDTVFMEVVLVTLGVHLIRRRQLIGDRRSYVVFALSLSVVTAVLMGYVVTNFGTLFRLRYLVATPFWMLALAVAPRRVPPVREADDRVGRE